MPRTAFLFLVLSATALAQTAQSNPFNGKTWWNYVKVLAADNMEGRDTGSDGLRRAQAYVVEQLKKNGLQPAGTDGFYQPIKFQSRRILEDQSSLLLVRDGKTEPLVLGDDAMLSPRAEQAEVEAPLVFIGYGLRVPEMHYDDLAGLDLKDKVAVIFSGSPADMPGALASHYQSAGERWKALKEAGVVGVITIQNPAAMDIPWERQRLSRNRPAMNLADSSLVDTAGQELAVTFNPAKADKLFQGSGHSFQEILDLGKDRKPLPHFPLALSVKARTQLATQKVESANLVAELPGSDPQLKNEYVVLSAHIDHVGIGEPINGDRIYNGAMDNASGSAALLDTASQLKKSHARFKRSLLFVFVTGEEKGLLGSKYFAAHPTVKMESIVSDINIDMFLPLFPLKSLMVLGLDESDLGDIVRQVAQQVGVEVQADPEPQRNRFIRSDQYNFIRHGVPSLAMKVGYAKGSPQEEIARKWTHDRYHAPSDDLDQPIDLSAAAGYENIISKLLVAIANSDHRAQWKPDSFFRRYAVSPGQ